MKVHGSFNPGKFSVETMPNKPGWCLCRFYENAHEYQTDEFSGWEYDEYHLELYGAKQSLETDIPNNFDVYFSAAKATEAPTETERLRADTDFLLIMGGWQ